MSGDRSFKRRPPWIRCLAAAVAMSGAWSCGNATQGPATGAMVPVKDTNPDPNVVEINLVASAGRQWYLPDGPASIWGYRDGSVNGSTAAVPGPLIQAKQGDTVIIHFENELPEGTTIHWHGVRVPNGSDGTLATQAEVPPGGRFDYTFVAVDAGTFWYHPHVRGDVQVERGLYGMLVVQGGVQVPVTEEREFILDDVKLEATGELSTTTDPLDVMLGRQGNVLLVNGSKAGQIELEVRGRERWRFVNAANGRYFNLQIPGQQFRVIGWDGGILASPYVADTLLIAPGERYEVLVELEGAGGPQLSLQNVYYDRGHDQPDPGPQDLLRIRLSGGAVALGALPGTWGVAPSLPVDDTTAVEQLVLSEDEGAPGQDPAFFINGRSFPDVDPLAGAAGDVAIWSIRNDSEMDHPFHLHGMFFSVLDVNGTPPEHAGWKDTVNVPQQSTLRFAVRYGVPGEWMFHCHILEHAERGMMSSIVLSPTP